MRHIPALAVRVLSLSFLFLLFVNFSTANTILAVGNGNGYGYSVGGPASVGTQYIASSWTSTIGYSGVSIKASLQGPTWNPQLCDDGVTDAETRSRNNSGRRPPDRDSLGK